MYGPQLWRSVARAGKLGSGLVPVPLALAPNGGWGYCGSTRYIKRRWGDIAADWSCNGSNRLWVDDRARHHNTIHWTSNAIAARTRAATIGVSRRRVTLRLLMGTTDDAREDYPNGD